VVGEGEAPDEAACGVAVEELDAAAADLIFKGSEMPGSPPWTIAKK